MPVCTSPVSGSLKDRAAKFMVLEAEQEGKLVPHSGQTIVEGTGGNTGVSLALIARARGYKAVLAMHDQVTMGKVSECIYMYMSV